MRRYRAATLGAVASSLLLATVLGCASTGSGGVAQFVFFAEAVPKGDPWFEKVAAWQKRAQRDAAENRFAGIGRASAGDPSRGPLTQSGLLHNKFGAFEIRERRALARRVNSWAQVQARKHYRWDRNDQPEADHWPTWEELLDRNGDDCDGLDLIAYHMLIAFGFPRDEIYRAIIRRERDRANHMVTLWFEDRENPWVIDTTGAMSINMRKISELPGWRPTKVFNETVQFAVEKRGPRPFALAPTP
jgi:predicted transglutaminase-like cysteine proteinase